MKIFKAILTLIVMFILILSFFQCSSSKKLQKESPIEFQDIYFQKWNSGIKGGGSGINIHIYTNNNSVILDSVYFRGEVSKLERKPNNTISYAGHFSLKESIGKTTKVSKTNTFFKLKDDECVISYVFETKTRYFKISNLKEKEVLNYPSALPNE